jgi:hypothetical protein
MFNSDPTRQIVSAWALLAIIAAVALFASVS